MRHASVVIGANYGDEGKGLMVDYLASQIHAEKVVVRFNGGAQAGHTVVTPTGVRHVFSHFGAGTLNGAQTFLAKHFVCNPLIFWHELRQLGDLNAVPIVVGVDPRCFITTPYDMIINQQVENSRGDKRHGSVGVGFGETIERNNLPAFRLLRVDLKNKQTIIDKLRLTRDHWLPQRLQALKAPAIPASDPRLSDASLDKVVAAFQAFDARTIIAGAEFMDRKAIIFEGAQGLALDMDSPNFPHVTRSNTGLTNVIPLAKILGLSLDVIYMTRPYITRHGAGPLPNEYIPNPPIVDDTNFEHAYQGPLRFGMLDMNDLNNRIASDLKTPGAETHIERHSFGLSRLDDIGGTSRLNEMAAKFGRLRFYSVGPRRNAVSEIMTEAKRAATR